LRLRGRSTISTGGARRLAAASPIMCDRPLGIALFLPVRIQRRDGRLRSMAGTKRNDIARKRGELSHDGVGRRLSPAIDARRRLNAHRRGAGWASASHVGPRDPRYDYLTRSYD
jgi:hypothetical protein